MGIFDILFKPDVERLSLKRDVKGLIRAIGYRRDWDVGKEAAYALVKIGTPAVEPWIAALKDEASYVRRRAAYALGEIKDPRAVEPLIAALRDGDRHVRNAAAEALGEIKDTRAVEPLIVALNDEDQFVRMGAAYALGEIKDPRAVEPLIAALKDEDEDVRSIAVRALVEIGTPAVEPLIAALKDVKSYVREEAAKALGEIKDPRAVEPLIAALKDEDEDVRWYVVEALVEIGGDRANKALNMEKGTHIRKVVRKIEGKKIKRLKEFLTKYKRGFDTPGGFDTSDMEDYIKCIEEVANLGTGDAISVLQKIEDEPCYAEIAIAVGIALRKLGRQQKPRPAYEPRELDSNYRSKNITEVFVSQLHQKMINLPITPDAFRDSFGDLEGGCRICKTIEEACTYVISFLKEREEAVDRFHNLGIESLGKDMIRVIFFLYEGGMEVFGSMNIARIGKDEYILQR